MVSQRITARDCEFYIGTIRVGGAEELTITIDHDLTDAHEGGSHFPVELIDGKISVTGSVTRAYIDNDLIKAITGNMSGIWPSFTITSNIVSGKSPERPITIIGAKFSSVSIEGLSLDSYAKNTLSFRALKCKFD